MPIDQHVVPGGVVGGPVEDDVQPEVVRHGHEVREVIEVADARQVRFGEPEGPLGGELTLVDLVDRRVLRPLRVGQRNVGGR